MRLKYTNLARDLRKHQTDTENKLWYFLRARRFQGLKFRRQFEIGSYIVDFCCPEKKLIVELDGGQHSSQKLLDKDRTNFLEQEGYQVLRFWNHELNGSTDAVLESMRLALQNHPHPTLSLKGRGEIK